MINKIYVLVYDISLDFMVVFLVLATFGTSAFCANVVVRETNPVLKRTVPSVKYGNPVNTPTGDVHVVQSGETLFGIAKQYDIPYKEILEENQISLTDKINVGQKLKIPQTKKAQNEKTVDTKPSSSKEPLSKQKIHIVMQGETLFGIARMYSVNALDLATENNVDLGYMVKSGQKLKIPHNSQDQESTQTPGSTTTKPTAQDSAGNNSTKKPSACSLNFAWPVRSREIIHKFGSVLPNGTKADGIIVASGQGSNITASHAGTVAYAGTDIPEYGKLMIIKHADNWLTIYGYMDSFEKSVGQNIKAGDIIGKTGKTGDAKQPSLYFSIRQVKKPYNPELCL